MRNYSLKNIVLGIGIGLVISSVVNLGTNSREMTVEEIKKEAAELNLIVLTKEEILNNQAPSTAAQSAETAPSPAAPELAQSEKVTITVVSGMTSESVAELLREKGVVEDTQAFLTRLKEVDKDGNLKVGSFEVTKGLGYDAIIKILAR